MAQRPARQGGQYNRYVSGTAALDYDYYERERRRHAERAEREYAERRDREQSVRPQQHRMKSARARRRRWEKNRVSPVALLGTIAAAAMILMLLMNYAELASISNSVVSMQKQLGTLEEEHVELLARYQRTFDLAAIKSAAEAAGMAKPSASQIYYVDLSEPDNVVLYQTEETNVLGKAAAAVGRNIGALVEYFR